MTPTTKDVSLQQILEGLVAEVRFGTKDAVAHAIGMSPSRLGRVMKGEGNSFDVLNCLKLADISGLPVDHILNAAGKSEIACLIRKLYGPAPPRAPEATFLATLSDEGRQALQVLAREFSKQKPPKRRRK